MSSSVDLPTEDKLEASPSPALSSDEECAVPGIEHIGTASAEFCRSLRIDHGIDPLPYVSRCDAFYENRMHHFDVLRITDESLSVRRMAGLDWRAQPFDVQAWATSLNSRIAQSSIASLRVDNCSVVETANGAENFYLFDPLRPSQHCTEILFDITCDSDVFPCLVLTPSCVDTIEYDTNGTYQNLSRLEQSASPASSTGLTYKVSRVILPWDSADVQNLLQRWKQVYEEHAHVTNPDYGITIRAKPFGICSDRSYADDDLHVRAHCLVRNHIFSSTKDMPKLDDFVTSNAKSLGKENFSFVTMNTMSSEGCAPTEEGVACHTEGWLFQIRPAVGKLAKKDLQLANATRMSRCPFGSGQMC